MLFSIVIPAHNEAENLSVLLPRLYASLSSLSADFEMLVINNASTDNTDRVVRAYAQTMSQLRCINEPTLGYGRAVLAGLQKTEGEYIGIMRSDNQEKPEDLCRMFTEIQKKNLSFYKGVRTHRMNDGVDRVIISFFYNILFKLLFGLQSRDLNATPKIFTREFLNAARLESEDWFIDAEMVIKAEKLGYAVGETDVAYLPRLNGKSKVRLRHVFEFLSNMLKWHSRIIHGRLLEE